MYVNTLSSSLFDTSIENLVSIMQEKVGIFFTLKARLIRLHKGATKEEDRKKIASALIAQREAEPIIMKALEEIINLKEMGVSLENAGNLVNIAYVSTLINKQISKVERLEGTIKIFSWTNVFLGLGALFFIKKVLF